jgi:hypothetical protein
MVRARGASKGTIGEDRSTPSVARAALTTTMDGMSDERRAEDPARARGSAIGGSDAGDDSTNGPGEPVLELDPSSVLRILLTIVVALLVLSIAGQALVMYTPDFPLRDAFANLFLLDWEQNIPTLYATLMLLASSFLLGLIAHARTGQPYARYWVALSIVFSFLALDEFASLHESAVDRVRAVFDISGGPLFFAWVIPGAVLVAAFAIVYLPFVRALPRPTRGRFLLAGLLFVGGAIGVEMLGSTRFASRGTSKDMTYVLISTVEEGMEMVGIAVFVSALLTYIAAAVPHPGWRLRVVDRGASTTKGDTA